MPRDVQDEAENRYADGLKHCAHIGYIIFVHLQTRPSDTAVIIVTLADHVRITYRHS